VNRRISFSVCAIVLLVAGASPSFADETGMFKVLQLPPKEGNPRNSEGDFITLHDGGILFVYTHFTGGAGDDASAYLAGRVSTDEGRTWSDEDRVVLRQEATQNVMSVSLLRLQDGRIALFYLRKNSRSDCRPYLRFSDDETQTWSEPIACIPDEEIGYYVLNNDRAVQLTSGRLLLPVAQHNAPDWEKWTPYGVALCYLSDDGGKTWRRSASELDGRQPDGRRVMLQEPGVVELKDGRLMMFLRTQSGCQYLSFSDDGGDHWSAVERSTILSPRSPASIERIPTTGDLLLVWNNHEGIAPSLKGKRTPLATAISRDEGATWENVKIIEDNPHGWYCYTAIHFVGDHVLLGYCAGDRRENNGLALTQITRLPVTWLYETRLGMNMR